MAKLKEEQLQRMKRIQDVDDDDLELDITRRHRPREVRTAETQTKTEEKQARQPYKGSRKENKNLLIVVGSIFLIVLMFVGILALYNPKKDVMTIDELHLANIEGKLDPEQGYIYNGYSFVKFVGVWYSQVEKGNTLYDITFNYDPKSVEDIPVEGRLSSRFKQEGRKLYITFDPYARSAKYIAVANAGLSMSLVKGFRYNLTAGCTDNESVTCQQTQVITCDDKDKAVIYFKEAAETKIILEDNCVTVQGAGPEIVRAKDRLLMRWYGIME
jgi:hypothetical protein